jgi:putative peptide zinc metalloprotease protein
MCSFGASTTMSEETPPKLKHEVKFFPIGDGVYHVYDPTNHRHFKMGRQEVAWLRLLDGQRSQEELRGDIPDELCDAFFFRLNQMALLEGSRHKPPFDLFRIKLPALEPTRLLNKAAVVSVAYRRCLNITAPFLLLLNALALPLAWRNIQGSLQAFHFSGWMIPAYLTVVFLCGVIHESSHALVAKSYGVHVTAAGFMLNYLHPAFYVDVSGINLLSSLRARINVLLAGIMANNVLITLSLLAYIFWQGHVGALYFLLVVWTNVILAVINLSPFVELDGYYVLLALFDEPAFRTTAMKSFRQGGPKRFEYLAYFVLSHAFAVAMITLALVQVRGLVLRFTHAAYVDYICLLSIIAAQLALAARTAKGNS